MSYEPADVSEYSRSGQGPEVTLVNQALIRDAAARVGDRIVAFTTQFAADVSAQLEATRRNK